MDDFFTFKRKIFLFLFFLLNASLIKEANADYNCEYKKDGFYPDLDFCHIYWRCNYGVAEEYECPAGTAWNHVENRCDWLDNVDCSRIEENGGKSHEKEDEDFKEEDIEETTKRIKPKKQTKSTTVVVETTHVASTAGVDTEFDFDAKTSKEFLGDVKNAFLSTTEKQILNNNLGGNQASSQTACGSFGSYYIPDSNCASYIMCNNGKETKMVCPEKQLFNTETTQCEDFQQVFCGARAVNLAEKNQCQYKRDGIYPDMERNCRVFYQCINQQKIREATCPNNLKFNGITGRCDNPNNIIAPCGSHNTTSSAIKLETLTTSLVFSFIWSIQSYFRM